MDKITITFSANQQELKRLRGIDKFASNTVSYIEAEFELGDNWQGYDSVRAIWRSDYECISTVLDSLGRCLIPFEVLRSKSAVTVNLVGSISSNDVLTDRLTTYPITALKINELAWICGANTSPITPSEYEQFVATVKADADRAEAGASAAEQSERNAKASEDNAKESETNSKTSEDNAKDSETNAKNSEDNAKLSEKIALGAAERAEQSAAQAGYMFFYIDDNGDLIYQHTTNVQVNFHLENGDLYVEAIA